MMLLDSVPPGFFSAGFFQGDVGQAFLANRWRAFDTRIFTFGRFVPGRNAVSAHLLLD